MYCAQVKIAEKVSALRVISADPTGPVFEITSLHMKTFTIKFDLDFIQSNPVNCNNSITITLNFIRFRIR